MHVIKHTDDMEQGPQCSTLPYVADSAATCIKGPLSPSHAPHTHPQRKRAPNKNTCTSHMHTHASWKRGGERWGRQREGKRAASQACEPGDGILVSTASTVILASSPLIVLIRLAHAGWRSHLPIFAITTDFCQQYWPPNMQFKHPVHLFFWATSAMHDEPHVARAYLIKLTMFYQASGVFATAETYVMLDSGLIEQHLLLSMCH